MLLQKYPTALKIIAGIIIGYIFTLCINQCNVTIGPSSKTAIVSKQDNLTDKDIKKNNDRLSYINTITAMSHTIEDNSGEITTTINFPAFSDRTNEEKNEILQKIKESKSMILTIGIASKYEDFSKDMNMLMKEISFKTLHIKFYTDTMNTTELLDSIIWKQSPDIKLIIEFINVDIAKDIRISDMLYSVSKMIYQNNGNVPVSLFSLIFSPFIDQFENTDRYILYPFDGKSLKNIPTKELYMSGITIAHIEDNISISEDRKGRIQNFFQTSPIPKIIIDSIGRKENNIITLYSF